MRQVCLHFDTTDSRGIIESNVQTRDGSGGSPKTDNGKSHISIEESAASLETGGFAVPSLKKPEMPVTSGMMVL